LIRAPVHRVVLPDAERSPTMSYIDKRTRIPIGGFPDRSVFSCLDQCSSVPIDLYRYDLDRENVPTCKPTNVLTHMPDSITIYQSLTHLIPGEVQCHLIRSKITNHYLWELTIQHWLWHHWNPRNIPGMLDLYAHNGDIGCRACLKLTPVRFTPSHGIRIDCYLFFNFNFFVIARARGFRARSNLCQPVFLTKRILSRRFISFHRNIKDVLCPQRRDRSVGARQLNAIELLSPLQKRLDKTYPNYTLLKRRKV
jgi:hypothetical protein